MGCIHTQRSWIVLRCHVTHCFLGDVLIIPCCPIHQCSPVLRALRWPSIKNQLLLRDATILYKIVNVIAPPYLECYVNKRSAIHSYNTRSRDNIAVPFCRTATAHRSCSYRAITAWNSFISEETKKTQHSEFFKRVIKREIYFIP